MYVAEPHHEQVPDEPVYPVQPPADDAVLSASDDQTKYSHRDMQPPERAILLADLAVCGKTVVLPAAVRTIWLEDLGSRPEVRAVGEIPECAGKESRTKE